MKAIEIKNGNILLNKYMKTVDVKYHNSFDDLMKVVAKVEKLNYRVVICFQNCWVENYDENGVDEDDVCYGFGKSKKEAIFDCMIQIIEIINPNLIYK